MSGLFAGTPLERPVTCEVCERPLVDCGCPRDAEGQHRPPASQTAAVRLERRRKGKVVTTVAGLDPTAAALDELGRELRNACGAGGTVRDGVIELQGDQRETVTAALRQRGFNVRA